MIRLKTFNVNVVRDGCCPDCKTHLFHPEHPELSSNLYKEEARYDGNHRYESLFTLRCRNCSTFVSINSQDVVYLKYLNKEIELPNPYNVKWEVTHFIVDNITYPFKEEKTTNEEVRS